MLASLQTCTHTYALSYPQAGRLGSIEGASSVDNCTLCSEGTYAAKEKASACVGCAPGTFTATLGSTLCDGCPAGRWSNATNATTNNTCVDCPEGTFSSATGVDAEDKCNACPVQFKHTNTCVYIHVHILSSQTC
jgi:uncharacterized membrane protein